MKNKTLVIFFSTVIILIPAISFSFTFDFSSGGDPSRVPAANSYRYRTVSDGSHLSGFGSYYGQIDDMAVATEIRLTDGSLVTVNSTSVTADNLNARITSPSGWGEYTLNLISGEILIEGGSKGSEDVAINPEQIQGYLQAVSNIIDMIDAQAKQETMVKNRAKLYRVINYLNKIRNKSIASIGSEDEAQEAEDSVYLFSKSGKNNKKRSLLDISLTESSFLEKDKPAKDETSEKDAYEAYLETVSSSR